MKHQREEDHQLDNAIDGADEQNIPALPCAAAIVDFALGDFDVFSIVGQCRQRPAKRVRFSETTKTRQCTELVDRSCWYAPADFRRFKRDAMAINVVDKTELVATPLRLILSQPHNDTVKANQEEHYQTQDDPSD